MREIKFRAWDTVRKKMFSAYEMGQDQEALLPDGRGFANISSTSTRLTEIHSHLIPLQYTGLKDKNGKEIYEGDIVHWNTKCDIKEEYRDSLWQVVWVMAGFTLKYVGGGKRSDSPFFKYSWKDNLQVIGNIYENKELLESGK